MGPDWNGIFREVSIQEDRDSKDKPRTMGGECEVCHDKRAWRANGRPGGAPTAQITGACGYKEDLDNSPINCGVNKGIT